jgi:hypothetical protein
MKNFLVFLTVFFLFLSAFFAHERELWSSSFRPLFQTTESPTDVGAGADVSTGIQLSLTDGINQNGKRTRVFSNSIDFGSVSFITPELASNGDVYPENHHLMLEAIVTVEMIFNGATSASMTLKRLRVSTNPFHQTYYSLQTNRQDVKTVIEEDPLQSSLGIFTEPTDLPLRLVFEISPQQKGHLTDRFELEANAL